jgi:hypothetical protein
MPSPFELLPAGVWLRWHLIWINARHSARAQAGINAVPALGNRPAS